MKSSIYCAFLIWAIVICSLLASCSKSKDTKTDRIDPPPTEQFSGLLDTMYKSNVGNSIVCVGNSLVEGLDSGETFPHHLQYMLDSVGIKNATVTNLGTFYFDIEYATSVEKSTMLPYKSNGSNVAVVLELDNDIRANRTQDAVPVDHMRKYCLALKADGWIVIVCTSPYRNTWYTDGDYTASGYDSTGFTTQLNNVNDSIRIGYKSYADYLVDLAADPHLSSYSTDYFQSNHWLLTAFGYQEVAIKVYDVLGTTNN